MTMTRRQLVSPVGTGVIAILLAIASSAESPTKPGNATRRTPGVQTRPAVQSPARPDQNRVARVKKRSGYIVVSGLAQ
jgi:hypothetical protein